jgi:type IV pilus assembly protein PilA
MKNKGFTLVELMVVILIVGILAAVAIPLMHGRIDSAKWAEAKAAMGTIATGLRAYYAEKQGWGDPAIDDLSDIGITEADLDGTYFEYDCYSFGSLDTTTAGGPQFTITADAGESGKTDKPTSPATITMTIEDSGSITWTEADE